MPKYQLLLTDDGHGEETAGKRTPIYPQGTIINGKNVGGTFMKENWFNRRVEGFLIELIKADGRIATAQGATELSDVPLTTRSKRANNNYANACTVHGAENVDCYGVSIHADAFGGKFVEGDPSGVSVHIRPDASIWAVKWAETLLKHLLEGTPQKNRGIVKQDLHMTRETEMPFALIECGFMDNLDEAKLLMSEAFQREVAQNIYDATLEVMGLPKKAAPPVLNLKINGAPSGIDIFVKDGVSYAPVRALAERLGCCVVWDAESLTVNVQAKK